MTSDEPGAAPARCCLLIVDDDPMMTDMLPRRLRKHFGETVQARILTATTAEEAEAIVSGPMEEDVLVVVCDFNLRSSRDGIEVLRSIESRAPHSFRILYSGHTREEIGPRAAQAHVHAFIEKPFRLDDMLPPLLDAIRTAKRRPPT